MIRKAAPLARVDVPSGVTEFFKSGKVPEPPGLASRAVVREARLAIHQALKMPGRAAPPDWRRVAMRLINHLSDVLAEDREVNVAARLELAMAITAGWRRWP